MSRRFGFVQTGILAAIVVSACLLNSRPALAGAFQPTFSASNFTPGAPIDNPYFPLVPGTTFHTSATVTDPDTGSTGFQRDEDFVTFNRTTIGGVPAQVVRARSFLDNVLIEDTLDYYAQDKSGNVWYLGEDTKAFEYDDQGHLINTDTSGSFRTGVNGALPGFIMPADQTIGFFYVQESAPKDGAQDQAQTASVTESVTVPFGHFTNVLKTVESSPEEPGVIENKFYAQGVGIIRVFEDIQPDGKPLNTFVLDSITTSSAIPLPPAAYAALFTLGFAIAVQKIRAASRFTA